MHAVQQIANGLYAGSFLAKGVNVKKACYYLGGNPLFKHLKSA